jgi:hypothetical protein
VVTTFDVDEYVYGALSGGAVGFILRTPALRCSPRPSEPRTSGRDRRLGVGERHREHLTPVVADGQVTARRAAGGFAPAARRS